MRLDPIAADPVTDYDARGVTAMSLAEGLGPWTGTVLFVDAGGSLGPHETGRDQVLLVVSGTGWLEVDGVRRELGAGDAGVVSAGVRHAKGSVTGMVALVLQSPAIAVPAERRAI